MTDETRIILHVSGENEATANRATTSLRQALLDLGEPSLQVEREKRDAHTQDMGVTLVLLLGAPAAVAVAQGIADWLRRRHADASIEIEVDGARVVVRGDAVGGVDVGALTKTLMGKKKP